MNWFRGLLLSALTISGVGCFPIELDVSPQGELVISRQEGWFVFNPATGKVRKVRSAGGDEPIFARFSPDGQTLLTIAAVAHGDGDFTFTTTPLDGGPSSLLLRTRHPAYVAYSPDGTRIAFTRVILDQGPGADDESGDLVLLDPQSGETRVLARHTGALFRWLPDSAGLLTAQIAGDETADRPEAVLVRVDAATGAATAIARISRDESYQIDISPDGTRALLCTAAAVEPEAALPMADIPTSQLYVIDLQTGDLRETGRSAHVALYSPDGRSVLIGRRGADGSAPEDGELLIGTADLEELRTVARDASLSDPSSGMTVYPGWIDNSRLFYFNERSVYGSSSMALCLTTLQVDGIGRKCVQPLIDRVAVDEE